MFNTMLHRGKVASSHDCSRPNLEGQYLTLLTELELTSIRCLTGNTNTVGGRSNNPSTNLSRLNYILWLQELLESTKAVDSDDYNQENRTIIGLDM
jgi:hypothetical protein